MHALSQMGPKSMSQMRPKHAAVESLEEMIELLQRGHIAPIVTVSMQDLLVTVPWGDDAGRVYPDPTRMPLIRFHPDEIRVIDMAYALDISSVVEKMGGDLTKIEGPHSLKIC
eukprot:Polyplicarium_translucidae@DN2633_c0_g1_i3.p4